MRPSPPPYTDPKLGHVKWVLPHAPERQVTANFGMVMPSWYDINSFDFNNRQEDEEGMLKSSRSIGELITAEVDAGIPSERIILGGFSQGGAMALLGGLTTERKLGGLVVLSSYLPLASKLKSMATEHARDLRIFWGHGEDDPLINIGLCNKSVETLAQQFGIKEVPEGRLTVKRYPELEHSTSQAEIRDVSVWLHEVIPETD